MARPSSSTPAPSLSSSTPPTGAPPSSPACGPSTSSPKPSLTSSKARATPLHHLTNSRSPAATSRSHCENHARQGRGSPRPQRRADEPPTRPDRPSGLSANATPTTTAASQRDLPPCHSERDDILRQRTLRREGIWGAGRGGSGDSLAERHPTCPPPPNRSTSRSPTSPTGGANEWPPSASSSTRPTPTSRKTSNGACPSGPTTAMSSASPPSRSTSRSTSSRVPPSPTRKASSTPASTPKPPAPSTSAKTTPSTSRLSAI